MNSILFISLMNTDAWGGSEVQWFALAKYYCHQGKQVNCLIYDWKEKKIKLQELEKLGASIIYIPNKGRQKKTIFERLEFEWITRIKQRLFINKFDFAKYDFVIVNQGGFMDVTNHPWKNVNKQLKSYCLTFHNYTIDFVFKKEKAELLMNWMKNAKVNIADAWRVGEILSNQLNTKFNNFKALVNPLTIKKSIDYTPYPNLPNGNYIIAMLAQLDFGRKAQDNLIKAIAQGNWKNRNVVFEIYGDGEHFDLLNELIENLQLTNKILLKGNTNNVALALENCHLVLQITHRDALPISVVEALSKSRACIVSDVGDMPLWVKENENGWIASNASIESIMDVLEKAWLQKDDWEMMGKKSFDIFKTNFPESVEKQFDLLINY